MQPVEEQETEQFNVGSTEDQSDLPNFKPWIDSWGSGDTLHEDADFLGTFLGSPPLPETVVHADQLPTDSVSRAFAATQMKQYSLYSESRYPRLVRAETYQRYPSLSKRTRAVNIFPTAYPTSLTKPLRFHILEPRCNPSIKLFRQTHQ